MAVKIQIRKSLKSEWELYNPTLAEGELGLETDTGYLKVGNGTDAWNSLEYWVPISATEIKSLYEGNSDTNAFTDALLSKLNGIEAGATQDQSAVEVPYDNVTSGLSATDTKGAIDEVTDRVGSVESNKQDILAEGAFEDGDKTKLNGIEAGATADQDAGEIKSLYESNSDTNAYTDAEKIKLAGVESGATQDQDAGEIKSLYESNSDTNAYTDAEKTNVADNTTARHTHANKTVLDKFGENGSGLPTYNGNDVDTTIAQRDVYDGLDSTDNTISLSAKQGKVLNDGKVDKVTSTDDAIVRFNGTNGEVQDSDVVIDDSGNVGVG